MEALGHRLRKQPWIVLIAAISVLLWGWQAGANHGSIDTEIWSRPSEIFKAFCSDLFAVTPDAPDHNMARSLSVHTGLTVLYFVAGFSIATIIGMVCGFLLGVSRSAYAIGHPVVDALRGLPSATIWPVLGMILGFKLRSQLVVIAFGATWPIMLNTMEGVRSLPQEVYDSLAFIRLEFYRRWLVIIFWSLPSIFTGLEVGCAVAFLLTVTVQLLWTANGGLGWYMDFYRTQGQPDRLFAGFFITAILGWGINTLIHRLRRLIVFWEEGDRDSMILPASSRWSRRLTLVEKVGDSRLKEILRTDKVTETIEAQFGIDSLSPEVLYQGDPYMFPAELKKHLDWHEGERLIQRDITISVPWDSGDAKKVILFARSWIRPSVLSADCLKKLEGQKMTIGKIVRQFGNGKACSYENLGYKEWISEKLGLAFQQSGTIHAVLRARVILMSGCPSIFIEEFVPVVESRKLQ